MAISYIKKETLPITHNDYVKDYYPKFYAPASWLDGVCTVNVTSKVSVYGREFNSDKDYGTKTVTGVPILGDDGLYYIDEPIKYSAPAKYDVVRLFIEVVPYRGQRITLDENGDTAFTDVVVVETSTARLEDWTYDSSAEYFVYFFPGLANRLHKQGPAGSEYYGRYVTVNHIYEMNGNNVVKDILVRPIVDEQAVCGKGRFKSVTTEEMNWGYGVKLEANMLTESPKDGTVYEIDASFRMEFIDGIMARQAYPDYAMRHTLRSGAFFSDEGKKLSLAQDVADKGASFGFFGGYTANGIGKYLVPSLDTDLSIFAHYVDESGSVIMLGSGRIESNGSAEISYGPNGEGEISFIGEPAVSYSTALSQTVYSVAGQTLPKAFYGKSAKRSMTFTAKGTNVDSPAEIDREKLEALALSGSAILRMPGGVTHKVAVQSVSYGYGYGNKVTGITIPMVEVQ